MSITLALLLGTLSLTSESFAEEITIFELNQRILDGTYDADGYIANQTQSFGYFGLPLFDIDKKELMFVSDDDINNNRESLFVSEQLHLQAISQSRTLSSEPSEFTTPVDIFLVDLDSKLSVEQQVELYFAKQFLGKHLTTEELEKKCFIII